MTTAQHALLVDAGLLFRHFHAMPMMWDSAGRPVNAVYGFCAMLLRELPSLRPTHTVVAFDVMRSQNHRVAIYPNYKGHRDECPLELQPQFDILQEALDAVGIPWIKAPGYEADDVIGTFAHQAEAQGMSATVLTGDRDALQLLSDRVTVRYVRRLNDLVDYTPDSFRAEYGLEPLQLIDLKALAGDASDNIPGVPGVGPKTATKLLQQHGDLESVLAAAGAVKGRTGQALLEHGDTARMCRRLATIARTAPVERAISDLGLRLQREEGQRKFEFLRFRSLQARLSACAGSLAAMGSA